MKTETIIVENVKCHGCANTIKKELSRIDGVSKVDVNVEEASVIIHYTGEKDMREAFVEKLRKLGYPEEGTGTVSRRVRSYISCAIGRIK